MIFLIVAVAVIGGTINNWISTKGKIADSQSKGTDDKTIKALEDRVATLEKIVTDRGYKLRDEIDAL
jgi:hypothetical protein